VDALTAFGLFSVTLMLVCYTLERRSAWFVLAFASACALASVYEIPTGGMAVRRCRGDLVAGGALSLAPSPLATPGGMT
jgi:hypothetical protein